MSPSRLRLTLAAGSGVALGLLLLAGWLAAWSLLGSGAAWFAPATATAGSLAWLASWLPPCRERRLLLAALSIAGGLALAVAAVAALALGAFLPVGLAAWLSPRLSQFGGRPALAIVALALAIPGLSGRSTERRGLLLDGAFACALGAWWVGHEVARQAAFPPPPTTPDFLAPRFTALGNLSLLLAASATLVWWRDRRVPRAAVAVDPVDPVASASRGADSLPYARWLWRWAGLLALGGLAGSLAARASYWRLFALLVAVVAVGGLLAGQWPSSRAAMIPVMPARRGLALVWTGARGLGWLVAAFLLLTVGYGAVAEDLETVLLRNTAERRVQQFWRATLTERPARTAPGGALVGTIRDNAGRELSGATVIVATRNGQTYTAISDAGGQYRLANVPPGDYLPLAIAPGFRQAPPAAWQRVVSVRPAHSTAGVDFRLPPIAPPAPFTGAVTLSVPEIVAVENPEPSAAIRRAFTMPLRDGTTDFGLVHEPPPAAGPGPFPILLVIYPGEARDWEGVSIPLAASGYVVVSYFPHRVLDLNGTLDDLHGLLALVGQGALSARGDGRQVVLVGGSVSTVYTYLMARELHGSAAWAPVRAMVQYGGLFDLFRFRQAWEEGQVIIDPGISALEYLLVAFGRPDIRPEIYLRFSPRYALGPASLPPTLLVHAGHDIIVPAEQSAIAATDFTFHGIDHQLLLYPDLEHYLDTSKRDPAQLDMLDQTLAFLGRYTARR